MRSTLITFDYLSLVFIYRSTSRSHKPNTKYLLKKSPYSASLNYWTNENGKLEETDYQLPLKTKNVVVLTKLKILVQTVFRADAVFAVYRQYKRFEIHNRSGIVYYNNW